MHDSHELSAWTSRYQVEQVVAGASPGDAVTNEAFTLQRMLRRWGFESHIYAEGIHTDLVGQVQPLDALRPPSGKELLLIVHYSIGSRVTRVVRELGCPLILVYHNVTPPEFIRPFEPRLAELLELGRLELPMLASQTALALADSEFNRQDLEHVGFRDTHVVPIMLDLSQLPQRPAPHILSQFNDDSTRFLFVGRLAANKKQDDLIRLFAYYQRAIDPHSHLFLVGSHGGWDGYARYLSRLVEQYQVQNVHFIGYVSPSELAAYYRLAHVFISMSEHEGFFVPAIECMYYGVPLLAYAAGAVPDTMGHSGVLFHAKDFRVVAEMAHLLAKDAELRQQIIAGQRRRLAEYLEESKPDLFSACLRRVFHRLSKP